MSNKQIYNFTSNTMHDININNKQKGNINNKITKNMEYFHIINWHNEIKNTDNKLVEKLILFIIK